MGEAKFFIFSGLPGSGKSTLAGLLAEKTAAVYLRVDTIEQGLRDLCHIKVEGEGYRLSYRIASENLSLGNSVIADSVNPWKLSRDEWNQVAIDLDVPFVNIEVSCSNPEEHRSRVESRKQAVPGLKMPTWEDVVNRDYHPWHIDPLRIDTSGKSINESFKELLTRLHIQ